MFQVINQNYVPYYTNWTVQFNYRFQIYPYPLDRQMATLTVVLNSKNFNWYYF